MTPLEILAHLTARDVLLQADGDNLVYDAPDGALLPCDLKMLRDHKAELIERLTSTGPLDPIDDEDVPAWLDDDSLTVGMATVRASIEYDQASRLVEARRPQQPDRNRRADKRTPAGSPHATTSATHRQAHDELITQDGGEPDGE